MGEVPSTSESGESGMTRRELLRAGGTGAAAVLGGVLLGIGGDEALSSDADLEALKLWDARKKVLDNVFLDANAREFYLEIVRGRVTIPAGKAVHAFPTRASEYAAGPVTGTAEEEQYFDRDQYPNSSYTLDAPMVVDNPVVTGGGMNAIFPPGVRWLVVDGPQGVGYVHTRLEERDDYGDSAHVLPASYWSGGGHDGQLRFTATGFAFQGNPDYRFPLNNPHGNDLTRDFGYHGQPNMEKLAEGMRHADFVPLSETAPQC